MDLDNVAQGLHPLERKVLPKIGKESTLSSLAKATSLSEIEVMRALQWLENKSLVKIAKSETEMIVPDKNGIFYLKNGLPERRFLEAIKECPLGLKEIAEVASLESDEINVCIGILKRKAAIVLADGEVSITENGIKVLSKPMLEEQFLERLNNDEVTVGSLKDEEKFSYDNLSKRKGVIQVKTIKHVSTSLTKEGSVIAKMKMGSGVVDTLTSEMIRKGEIEGPFRRYDVSINVPKINGGRRHFVNQAIRYIKQIWLDLGFTEMQGNMVQTAFWDLDALFVPQDHPARDEQDTFYLKDPRSGKLPKDMHKKLKEVHENGGNTGSLGWRYKYSDDIAKENLLRTHTTVLSAQTLAKLKEEDMPAKFFSVKKVFRNETLSWKSLFEFIQVEGIVVDPDANFKHLKGYLKNFFAKMGFPDVRIRPGHFPYTEPSAEIDVWHPVKKQWVEVGGSGIFRPELTKPLIGREVPVLAWGLGMERSIMQYYNMTDIRDIYKNDLKQLKELKFWMR